MICPKCGFEQPESPECVRCGVIVSRYKGRVFGAAPGPSEPPPLPSMQAVPPPLPLSMESGGSLYGDPEPAMAAAGGGTLYQGPMAAATAGGMVYGAPITATGRVRGRFEIGKILSETFSVYFANFIPFALLTGLVLSPVYLLQGYAAASAQDPITVSGFSGVSRFLSLLCEQIATAAITYGVFQQMRGRETSIGDCLRRGLSSLGAVLGLALLQGICILLGLLLCIVPGILLAVRWAVSIPAAVEERPGVGGAMERSTFLTDGYRWDIFCVLFVLVALNLGAVFVAALASSDNTQLQLVLQGIVDLLATGLSATAASVMYYRLRSVKESIDVDQISSVFA
jgi:hypothetical protein